MMFRLGLWHRAAGSFEEFDALASEFAVLASADTQVVRVELSEDGSPRSLRGHGLGAVAGDIMLTPTDRLTQPPPRQRR